MHGDRVCTIKNSKVFSMCPLREYNGTHVSEAICSKSPSDISVCNSSLLSQSEPGGQIHSPLMGECQKYNNPSTIHVLQP